MEHRGAKGQRDTKAPDHLKPIIKQANQWRWSFNATEQSIASLWVWFDVFEPSGMEVMPVHFCVLFFCFALRQISEIHVTGESEDMTAKERLLLWSKQTTEGYVGVRCENFTTSWRDGRLFNALIHKYRYYNKHTHNTACFCRAIVLLVFFWFIQKMQLMWTSLLEFLFIIIFIIFSCPILTVLHRIYLPLPLSITDRTLWTWAVCQHRPTDQI